MKTTARPLIFSSITLLLSLSACGGPDKPAEEPTQEQDTQRNHDSTRSIGAMAEVGAMPEEATINAFKGAFDGIQKCFGDAAQRLEFIGGHIALKVVVDSKGNTTHVFAKDSTLGDRQTEQCMFDVLRQAPWPAPVDGLTGEAENSFEFEVTGDVRPPVDWGTDQVDEMLSTEATAISECKAHTRGQFTATVYVDTSGKAMSVGMSAPNKDSEAASDCLVNVLSSAEYPSPGSWPAKVTFHL